MFGIGFLMTLIGMLAEAPEAFVLAQQNSSTGGSPGYIAWLSGFGTWYELWLAGLSSWYEIRLIFNSDLPNLLTLQPDDITRQCLAWIGFLLCLCGLYRMAMAKWRHWGVSLLALFGLPGTVIGLVIALVLRSRNPRWGRKKQSRARRTLGRAKPFRRPT